MSKSAESVDHEVEVCMPELVLFEDGGQCYIYHDCEILNNKEVLVESVTFRKEVMQTTTSLLHRWAPSGVFLKEQKFGNFQVSTNR